MTTTTEFSDFLKAISERMTALNDSLGESDRGRFNDAEQAEWDQLEDWAVDANAGMDRLNQIGNLAAHDGNVTAMTAPTATRTAQPETGDPWATDGLKLRSNAADVRSQAVTAIETLSDVPDDVRSRIVDVMERSDDRRGSLAAHVLATASPGYREAFRAAMFGDSMTLTDAHRQTLAISNAITLTSGFAFPATVDPTILHIGDGSTNPMRQFATVRSIVTPTHSVNTMGSVVASRDGEVAEVSDDTPGDDKVDITPTAVQAFVEFSIDSEQDLVSLEADLRDALGMAKDDEEAVQFLTGAMGVVTGATSTVASAGAGAFALADVFALFDALPARHRGRGAWVGSQPIYSVIRQMDTAGGAALWERLANGDPATLLGRPAGEASEMDTTTGAADEPLLFGDFASGFRIADRVGMSVERVNLVLDTANNRPNGKRGLYARWRNGAAVINPNAIRKLVIG